MWPVNSRFKPSRPGRCATALGRPSSTNCRDAATAGAAQPLDNIVRHAGFVAGGTTDVDQVEQGLANKVGRHVS